MVIIAIYTLTKQCGRLLLINLNGIHWEHGCVCESVGSRCYRDVHATLSIMKALCVTFRLPTLSVSVSEGSTTLILINVTLFLTLTQNLACLLELPCDFTLPKLWSGICFIGAIGSTQTGSLMTWALDPNVFSNITPWPDRSILSS